MPIYEYVCQSCGDDFEKLTSFSNTSVPACPSCHSTSVERQLSTPAIHFKGSGWYINDSKPSTKESANGATNGNGAGKETGNGKEGDTSAKSTDSEPKAKADSSNGDTAKKDTVKSDSAKDSTDTSRSTKNAKKAPAA